MYEYEEESNPLQIQLPSNIEIQLDTLPVIHPYVPRICKNRGYFLIWYGNTISDSDLVENCIKAKEELQWIRCSQDWMIEKGVALIYPYHDEIIIGSVKTAGYMGVRTKPQLRKFIKSMWTDIVTIFGNKKIICPSGSYIEQLHINMNKKLIPHECYHWKVMKQHQFKRIGEYWIR
jgi:hypothetical protein